MFNICFCLRPVSKNVTLSKENVSDLWCVFSLDSLTWDLRFDASSERSIIRQVIKKALRIG